MADYIYLNFLKLNMESRETQTEDQELIHYRAENIRLQKQLKQVQDNLALYAANNNNTSSKFMLPSEFKVKWEGMIKETMPSAFISLFEFPLLSVYAIQGLAMQVLKSVKECLLGKTTQFANLLGTNIESLHQNTLLLKIFQDHYQTLIRQELEPKALLSGLLQECVEKYYEDHREAIECKNQWIEELEENEDLTQWISTFWSLCCFIQLSEQNIQFALTEIKIEFIPFKKNEFYCVDGFGKDGANSLVIIPPVMRADQVYNGLKHAILILSPQDQNLQHDLLAREQQKLEDITNISIIKEECRIKICHQDSQEDNYLQKILRQNNSLKGKIINQRISKTKQDELRQNM